MRRCAEAVAVVAALSLVVTGCSSSGSGNNSSGGASPTGGTTASGSGSGSGATGSTILVGGEASLKNPTYSSPQTKAGLEAAISSINAAGGVAGHPLKLDFCDNNYTVNQEVSCTRQLIKDKVAAILAPNILADTSGAEYKFAEAAKIPIIGGEGLTPAELTSPVAFPLSSGLPGWVYGATQALLGAGSKKVSILVDTNPTSQYFGSLVSAALKSAGMKPTETVAADLTADPTGATAAAKVIGGGTDGIVLAPAPTAVPKLLTALKQAGYKGKVSSITAIFPPPLIKAAGAAAEGVLLTSQVAFSTDSANPGISAFNADMKKYQPSSVIDESTLFAWGSAQLFAKVAGAAKADDASSVLAAFTGLSTPVDIGIAAPYSVAGKKSPLPDFTRIFNPTVQDGVVTNGVIQANGKGFVNPFTALAGLASN
jgi:branched-chain amino acid transport system substrate-binding protein